MKISTVHKLDGIRSWSLPAGKTCPGSALAGGGVSLVCQGCYAKGGNYRFKNVKNAREHNLRDWKRKNWVKDMAEELARDAYFRWFDSGDCYSPLLAEKILRVMMLTPHCKHWMSTRMYKFPDVRMWLDAMNSLPNVRVRYSADTLDGTYDKATHGAIVLPDNVSPPKGVFLCPAYDHPDEKCDGCRACWSKRVKTVGYKTHGAAMLRLVRKQQAETVSPEWARAARRKGT